MSESVNAKSVAELAEVVGGRVVGDGSVLVSGVASLERAGAGDAAFVQDAKSSDAARTSGAGCLVVPEGAEVAARALIVARNPKLAFARIAAALRPPRSVKPGVHPSAIIAAGAEVAPDAQVGAHVCIGEGARVGAGARVDAGVSIGDRVSVGAGCVLRPNVVIYEDVTIGARVFVHAGAVIGADGFGFVRDEGTGEYVKFPQTGTVVIDDDAEIGAGACIDRAALGGTTHIGRGTKIDNLVHVGHNVSIGARCVIAAQTGISGSTVIEDDCVIGGQVGFGDHARVERGAIIGSKAGVLPGKIVRGQGRVYWGVPVRPLDEYKRMNAHMGRLGQTRAEVDDLRARVAELERRLKTDEGGA